jgi:DNA-binding MarR family transcriptional regulator
MTTAVVSRLNMRKSTYDVEHRTAYRFAMMSAMSTRSMASLFRRRGLTDLGWRVFSLIGHHEPVHPSHIAKRATFDPDKVSRAVDRLVRSGLVTRTVDSADRRRIILTLTPRGRKVYSEIEQARREMEREFLSVLTPEELRAFHAALDKLEAQSRKLFQPNKSGPKASD